MKKTLLIFAALTALHAAAQETKTSVNDTIVVNTPGSVMVTRGKDGAIAVAVQGKERNSQYRLKYKTRVEEKDTTEWNLDFPFLKNIKTKPATETKTKAKAKSEWRMTSLGLYYNGIICSGEPAGSRLHGGLEFGFTHLIGFRYNFGNSGYSFSTGLGVNGQVFRASGCSKRFMKDGKKLSFEPLPEGATDASYNIVRSQLNVPLQLNKRFNKHFGVTAGVLLNYNHNIGVNSDYTLNGIEYSEQLRNFDTRAFSYDIMASVGWRYFSLFGKYSPQGMFREGCGPEFKSFSIGIRIGNF